MAWVGLVTVELFFHLVRPIWGPRVLVLSEVGVLLLLLQWERQQCFRDEWFD
jgi:hypothetical protein